LYDTHISDLYPVIFYITPMINLFFTLSLHDALPISLSTTLGFLDTPLVDDWTEIQLLNPNKTNFSFPVEFLQVKLDYDMFSPFRDRKSTRLNSSHVKILYAVFCLKKKITLILIIYHY